MTPHNEVEDIPKFYSGGRALAKGEVVVTYKDHLAALTTHGAKEYERGREAERKRILNKLSDPSLHSEVIFKVLGAGHHYSTMPVVAGIVSRLKEALTQPNNPK